MSSTVVISSLLNKRRTKDAYQTHVTLNPKGKYQFDRTTLEELFKTYCDVVYDGGSTKQLFTIAEKPQQYLPVLVDIDIKIEIKEDGECPPLDENIYTTENVEKIVEIYQSVIRNILEDCQESNLICAVLEKPAYIDETKGRRYFKNGFHLHFPWTFMNTLDQQVHLIPRIQKIADQRKVFDNIRDVDKSSRLIDKSYCKIPWLLYGSRKGNHMQPYTITHIYDANLHRISMEDAFTGYSVYDDNETEIHFSKPIEYYLPRILSIIPHGRDEMMCELKQNLSSPIAAKLIKNKEKKYEAYRRRPVEEDLKDAGKLVRMLGAWRAADRNEWMNICWVLYNVGDGCQEALDIWVEFSRRCGEKFNESFCVNTWNNTVKKDMSIATLRHYAKIDNPTEYAKFVTENMEKHITNSIEGSHNDLAKALYEKYGDQFVCSSINSRIWYHFQDHVWKQVEDGVSLRTKISSELSEPYKLKSKQLGAELGELYSDETKKLGQQQKTREIQQVSKMISNLKQSPFKNNVMKECMEVFYDETFASKLNNNKYLIAFNNGVYDLKKKTFRDGIPEDFISIKMNVNYNDEMSEKHPKVLEAHEFFEKIFPDKSVRDYFLDTSSDVFIGGNPHKVVQVWTGHGNNGKSITQEIFEKMLGKYAIKLPTSLLTGKRSQASAACPELARAGNGVRWCVLQEPDKRDTLNIGILKELSGNDTFFARGLYKEGQEITPMFKLVLVCNKPPKVPHDDQATWNRIRVIPFEATFTHQAPESYEEQLHDKVFPIDTQFSDKIPGLLEAVAWLLLDHRKKTTKRVEPEKVRLATSEYRKQNDIYRQYIEENLQTEVEEKYKMSLVDLYNNFKEWFKDSMSSNNYPVKNEVREYFETEWGQPVSEGIIWKGVKFRNVAQEIEDGDAFVLGDSDLTSGGPPM